MSLSDENPSVMDGFSESKFEHLGLQPPFQEIFNFQTKHVIELHAGFIQHTDTN